MANIKSAKKRIRQNAKQHFRNQSVKSRVKTYIKQAENAISQTNPGDDVETAVLRAVSEVDRAVSKGVLHPNNGARKKSSLQRRAAQALSSSDTA